MIAYIIITNERLYYFILSMKLYYFHQCKTIIFSSALSYIIFISGKLYYFLQRQPILLSPMTGYISILKLKVYYHHHPCIAIFLSSFSTPVILAGWNPERWMRCIVFYSKQFISAHLDATHSISASKRCDTHYCLRRSTHERCHKHYCLRRSSSECCHTHYFWDDQMVITILNNVPSMHFERWAVAISRGQESRILPLTTSSSSVYYSNISNAELHYDYLCIATLLLSV